MKRPPPAVRGNESEGRLVLGMQEVASIQLMETHPMIDSFRPRYAQVPGVTCCLIGIVSCAISVPLTPQRVDGVPAGRYHVTVSADRTGIHKYNALLFETAAAAVTLDLPTGSGGGGM